LSSLLSINVDLRLIEPHHYCPNVNLVKPYNMAKLLAIEDIVAFFDLNLIIHKSHTPAPKRKEMAYEFWADDIFSTHVCQAIGSDLPIDISGNDLYSSGMALGRLQIRKYKEP
jgi:hypothetical protein